MIVINGTTQLMTVTVNEAYKSINDEWQKIVVLKFPTDLYSAETAQEIATTVENIKTTTDTETILYYTGGIEEVKQQVGFTDVWMICANIEKSAVLVDRVTEVEQLLTTMLGGTENDETTVGG